MKILLVLILAVSSSAMACDGTCSCGGVPIPTKSEQLNQGVKAVGEWVAYLGVGYYVSAQGIASWPIGIPSLCIYLSRGQRAYNRSNGIKHSRSTRPNHKGGE